MPSQLDIIVRLYLLSNSYFIHLVHTQVQYIHLCYKQFYVNQHVQVECSTLAIWLCAIPMSSLNTLKNIASNNSVPIFTAIVST